MNEMNDSSVNVPNQNENSVVELTREASSNVNDRDFDDERRFTQKDIDVAVGKAAKAIKEKERSKNSTDQSYSNNSQYESPKNTYNPQDIQVEVEKVLQQKKDNEHANNMLREAEKVIETFSSKLNDGVNSYSDFVDKITTLDLEKNPIIIKELAGIDNTADVLYALSEDPKSYMDITNGLSNPVTEKAARSYLDKLINKVKSDKEASKIHNTRKLPSQIKSSPMSTGTGRPSWNDQVNDPGNMW